MIPQELQTLRKECYKANLELPKLGLVLYTFGNLSIADHSLGVMAIKPSGVPYEDLKEEEIVLLSIADGKPLEGEGYSSCRPSSDASTHLVLYREFPLIKSIVHTHSSCATSWAQAGRDIPIYGTTHADHLAGPIPCTGMIPEERLEKDYESETGFLIAEELRKRSLSVEECKMILCAGHGPFTWGKTADEALYNARTLEELGYMAMMTESIAGSPRELPSYLIRKHYERKHGKNAYYGQK